MSRNIIFLNLNKECVMRFEFFRSMKEIILAGLPGAGIIIVGIGLGFDEYLSLIIGLLASLLVAFMIQGRRRRKLFWREKDSI